MDGWMDLQEHQADEMASRKSSKTRYNTDRKESLPAINIVCYKGEKREHRHWATLNIVQDSICPAVYAKKHAEVSEIIISFYLWSPCLAQPNVYS